MPTVNRFLGQIFFIVLAAGVARVSAAGPDHDLVPIETVQPPCLPEVRYATRHNFTGKVLYPIPRVFLHRDAARALTRVQRDLQRRGLGLKVWDAYRPLSVQRKMWNLIRDERYVSNPAKNKGRHTRGTAVDVTLVDKLGRELTMPSDFDDFSERAHRDYRGGTSGQRRNRQLLESVMQRHGFVGYPTEWWHFDLANWEKYPPLDIPIDELARTTESVPSRGQIEHAVYVWLKRPGNARDRAALVAATEELMRSTGLIRSFHHGRPVPNNRPVVDDTFDLAIIMRFDNARALATFEKHPEHQRAKREILQPLSRKVVVYDTALE
jgi:D-alanyl-D-alanine dipeptidase